MLVYSFALCGLSLISFFFFSFWLLFISLISFTRQFFSSISSSHWFFFLYSSRCVACFLFCHLFLFRLFSFWSCWKMCLNWARFFAALDLCPLLAIRTLWIFGFSHAMNSELTFAIHISMRGHPLAYIKCLRNISFGQFDERWSINRHDHFP